MAETEREKDLEIQRREASCAKQLAEIKHRLLSLQQSRAQGSLSPAQDLGARGLGDAEAAAAAAAAAAVAAEKSRHVQELAALRAEHAQVPLCDSVRPCVCLPLRLRLCLLACLRALGLRAGGDMHVHRRWVAGGNYLS